MSPDWFDAIDTPVSAPKNGRVNKVVGPRVRQLRQARQWTQADLAKKAKVALGTVQTLEAGKRTPRWVSVERIAKALGQTPEALVQPDDVTPTDPLLKGLRREDLLVARAYKFASSLVRLRVQQQLQEHELSTDRDTDPTKTIADLNALTALLVAGTSSEFTARIQAGLARVKPGSRGRLLELIATTIDAYGQDQLESELAARSTESPAAPPMRAAGGRSERSRK